MHKDLLNKLTVILFQEVCSLDVCWPSSLVAGPVCRHLSPLLVVYFADPLLLLLPCLQFPLIPDYL